MEHAPRWTRLAPWLLGLVWALVPAIPALGRGELLGHPYTDLYPSVWGLWAFAESLPAFLTHTGQLAAPSGMAFYYSSPLHGLLAWPLLGLLGLPATWNLLTLGARVAGVVLAFHAARAWKLEPTGALVAAAVYGAAPFFHGYSVEGIVEGQDGWTLALWLIAVGRGWRLRASLAFALVLLSSWYLGAVACVMAVLLGRRGAWSLAGLVIAAPALWIFFSTFPAAAPLDPEVRRAMGTAIGTWTPGVAEGLNPFAKTSWIGFCAPILAFFAWRGHRRVVLGAGLFFLLSLGWGPWYEWPPFSSIRFPYRFHAGTLVGLAFLAGHGAQKWGRGAWLAPLVVIEGLLLSPVEAWIPGAPAEIPSLYAGLDGIVLDIPGPVAVAPGLVNRSRVRARWFLYAQTGSGHQSPWIPDFNGVGVVQEEPAWLGPVRALDPLNEMGPPATLVIPRTIGTIILHRGMLGGTVELAHSLLLADGWTREEEDEERWLYLRDSP